MVHASDTQHLYLLLGTNIRIFVSHIFIAVEERPDDVFESLIATDISIKLDVLPCEVLILSVWFGTHAS